MPGSRKIMDLESWVHKDGTTRKMGPERWERGETFGWECLLYPERALSGQEKITLTIRVIRLYMILGP